MERTKLRTGVSHAYWCTLGDGIARFEPAKIRIGEGKAENISWFDMMFEGGILLPEDLEVGEDQPEKNQPGKRGKALTFLITGPPGSGKTTLALELCYRLAKNEGDLNKKNLFSLYISTEAESERLIKNAISYGWDDAEDYIIEVDKPGNLARLESVVAVWGRDNLQGAIENWRSISDLVTSALESLNRWIRVAAPQRVINRLKQIIDATPLREGVSRVSPDILVVDSLNIVEPEESKEFFQQFISTASASTKIIIFILDSGSTDEDHKFWEYYSDIVVRMDHSYAEDYYMRTLEVVKARYQSHIWGKHQLKIYGQRILPEEPETSFPNDPKVREYNIKLRRAHPYRRQGGIFLFPSIHYYLSLYKRRSSTEVPLGVETYPEKLNEIVRIPGGRCTALIGPRGGHKSHLGFVHALYKLLSDESEGCLVISLREDEGVTKKTLEQILRQEFPGRSDDLSLFEKKNRLEILYYPPGYITPEEFFHRMFISIHRLKKTNKRLTVLFNSLDQLSARFPLCAKQEIFVPGIIETLSGEGITSICIAVDEPGQPIELYGLLPMADLILSFNTYQFKVKNYYNHLNESWKFEEDTDLNEKAIRIWKEYEQRPSTIQETIVLEVVRFAGGERAGARGILELVNKKDLDNALYPREGLHFTRLSPNIDPEEMVKVSY